MRGPVLTIVATFLIAACGEPPPPQLIETSQIKPLLVEGNTLDGRRIAVDGYIDVDDGPESLGGAAMA